MIHANASKRSCHRIEYVADSGRAHRCKINLVFRLSAKHCLANSGEIRWWDFGWCCGRRQNWNNRWSRDAGFVRPWVTSVDNGELRCSAAVIHHFQDS
jgi:hypothetical protein